ncbi:tRNA (adenosine(37)-N6)-dimethylallyltransferase MiaA [Planctomicrobium piriforme]|uniref:tRNA dimethylallyltransferase n=1 Tax=Planctomicrobium piriforme TaxID=1576369 RepID=A0A1I3BHX4_9PLAN|nr:tRNA (adenosine(37)-N6)-dimethylallyltransferase MiaA [Planctomicrobium piriforme]SFH61873.1 tRNA dimethylallyltransferase [Planctomicrobium piriforme]
MKFPLELLQRCWFLAGPTAVGKSELSLQLAEQLGGEILSLDSMAIFRGMDIGTAKPAARQQQRVPHHLIDLVEPHEEFSTAQFLVAAEQACREICERGRVPIFVGGTGLYLRAVLRGVFEGPPADWKFRDELTAQAAGQSPDWLHEKLRQIDPATADRLHPNDSRRLVRALEIVHLTGQLPSVLQQEHPLPVEQRPRHIYWLHPPRAWLADRINRRVDAMFELGLEEEVRSLLDRQHPPGRTARQALGYREMIDYLEDRLPSLDETRQLIQTRTRQFAKRQHTWFRNLEECREVAIEGTESVDELCDRLLSMGETTP